MPEGSERILGLGYDHTLVAQPIASMPKFNCADDPYGESAPQNVLEHLKAA